MLAGIFVGGASRRMGRPKGLLPAPDAPTLIERWVKLLEALGAEVVLVGRREEYAHLALETLDDARVEAGPLAGLVALLDRAGEGYVLALACDMPFVERADLERLIAAPETNIAAPRRDGRWEPLCARYRAAGVGPIAQDRLRRGQLALQGLLDAAGATEVAIDPSHLRDWDRPEDLR